MGQQQQTLRESITYSGIGLHSGQAVELTFIPAPPNSGLRFRRVDLEGKPEIEAQIENVVDTNRSTTLSKGTVKIHTVEHVLSTLAGYGIDNLVIELNANEPPIGDGSARQFSQMVMDAGIEVQSEPRKPYRLTVPLQFELGETLISAFPSDALKITCTSSDRQARFTQYFSLEISPESWERELSGARTFCFYEEIEFLIKNGLIRGGSLENAVVIRDDAVLTTEPLRYPEEFVRHKILDIVGDLALLGRPLLAHIVAVKPSHAANCELARQVLSLVEKRDGMVMTGEGTKKTMDGSESLPAGAPAGGQTGMDINEIMKILPHRYPFLLVDRVLRLQENQIRALKNVTVNESFFQGHFPGHPIMPGVLQLEAIAQVAGILMLKQIENFGKIAYFMSAEKVKWRKPVRPGDQLVIDVELTKFRGKIAKARGVCSVGDEVVSEGEITVMLTEG